MIAQHVALSVTAGARRRPSTSGWAIQMFGGLLFAAVLPYLIFSNLPTSMLLERFRGFDYVLYGSAAAIIIGQYFYGRMVLFPGARAASYIAPTFTATFAAVLAIFFFFRFDYARFHFAASYIACLIWYFGCHYVTARARVRKLAIVPVGGARALQSLPLVDWVPLSEDRVESAEYDGVVADFRADIPDHWERFIAETAIAGIPVYHFKQIRESITGRVDIEHLSENNFGSLIPGMAYLKIKQWLDMVAALVLGAILLPVLLVVALLVRMSSPGPIIFRQTRMGYRGHPFIIYKFRTMRERPSEADARTGAITRDGDDRVTPIGRFLRRSRIDELPQILNILRGEMSWIGPRPEAVPLSEWYECEIPFYRYRHIVRPGITGWAQVNQGHVAEIADVHAKLQYDFYYVKYFSPWLDLLIVFRTVRTVLTGFGSK